MTGNRRLAQRRNGFTFGTLRRAGSADIIECLVWDVSEGGARIEVETPEAVPERFSLATTAYAPPREASVAWRRGRRFGVTFGA